MSGMEMIVIAVVALVAIGPKDLPKALRMVGQIMAKVRRMAGEFQSQFNEAIREADLEELRKSASDINDAVAPFKSGFDPLKSAGEQLKNAIGEVALPEPVVVEPSAPLVPSEPKKRVARKPTVKKAEAVVEPVVELPEKAERKKPPAKAKATPVKTAVQRIRKATKPDENV